MFVAGIVIVVVATLIRVWAAIQAHRGEMWQAPIFSLCGRTRYGGCVFAFLSVTLAIVGAILIGICRGLGAGLVSFGLFWFSRYLVAR